jgi:hypothetical protein
MVEEDGDMTGVFVAVFPEMGNQHREFEGP